MSTRKGWLRHDKRGRGRVRNITAGALGLDGAGAIDGLAEAVHDTAKHLRAHVHVHDRPRSLHLGTGRKWDNKGDGSKKGRGIKGGLGWCKIRFMFTVTTNQQKRRQKGRQRHESRPKTDNMCLSAGT